MRGRKDGGKKNEFNFYDEVIRMCTTQTASYKVVKYFSSRSRIRTWLTCYFNNKGSTLLNGSGFDSA